MSLTMKQKQAVTKQLALEYKRAAKKRKGKILDTLITLTCRLQPLLCVQGTTQASQA